MVSPIEQTATSAQTAEPSLSHPKKGQAKNPSQKLAPLLSRRPCPGNTWAENSF